MSHLVMYLIVMFNKISIGLGWLIFLSAFFTCVCMIIKFIVRPLYMLEYPHGHAETLLKGADYAISNWKCTHMGLI